MMFMQWRIIAHTHTRIQPAYLYVQCVSQNFSWFLIELFQKRKGERFWESVGLYTHLHYNRIGHRIGMTRQPHMLTRPHHFPGDPVVAYNDETVGCLVIRWRRMRRADSAVVSRSLRRPLKWAACITSSSVWSVHRNQSDLYLYIRWPKILNHYRIINKLY